MSKMKNVIPIQKLKEAISGIRIDRMSDDYVGAQIRELANSHRNDYYMCLILEKGSADFFIDFQHVNLKPDSLLFLYPGQIQRIISINQSSGWILFFDNKLMDDHSRLVLEESLYQGPVLPLLETETGWFFPMMTLLYETYQLPEMASFHKPAMQSLLSACIYRIASMYQARIRIDMKQHSPRSVTIIKSFRKLLRENYKTIKRPADYASLMNLSLGYLNDTVKTLTGFSVSYSIQQETIREAQRLLCHSDLSIKEIADQVGFDDAKYFSRMFNKTTGQSPGNFRKNYQREET